MKLLKWNQDEPGITTMPSLPSQFVDDSPNGAIVKTWCMVIHPTMGILMMGIEIPSELD